MSQVRKAKVGEPFCIDIEGRFYDEHVTASFGPLYDDNLVGIERVSMKFPGGKKKLAVGEECLYEYKITPKKKGHSKVKFGTWGCFGFSENYSLDIEAE